MSHEDEVVTLAHEMQQCAENEDFEKLAELMPTPQQFSDFMMRMFSQTEVVDQYEKKGAWHRISGVLTMRLANPKKMAASAIVFLFTSMSTPGISATIDQVQNTPQSTNEVALTQSMPLVDIGIPRVVYLAKTGNADSLHTGGNAVIRSIDYSYNLMNDLQKAPLIFGHDIVTISRGYYSNQVGAYVSMSSTDLQTGCIKIENGTTLLEQNIKNLLFNPEQYKVRPDLVNVQLAPKIISDSISGSTLLAMEAWDFRLASQSIYSDVSLNQMLLNAYATFKSYATIQHKLNPSSPVVIHTSFWGTNYKNNAKVTTAIQLIAAHLAAVDKVIFYADPQSPAADALHEAQDFVQSQEGNSIADVMVNLLHQSEEVSWRAGSCTIAAFTGVSHTTVTQS